MLMVHKVSLYGDLSEIKKEPPLVVIEVYDEDALVRVLFISLVMCIYMFLHFQLDCGAYLIRSNKNLHLY